MSAALGVALANGLGGLRCNDLSLQRSWRLDHLDPVLCRNSAELMVQVPLVRVVTTILWTWGWVRPCGPLWCSKDAMTQRCGLSAANRVRPTCCRNSSAA